MRKEKKTGINRYMILARIIFGVSICLLAASFHVSEDNMVWIARIGAAYGFFGYFAMWLIDKRDRRRK